MWSLPKVQLVAENIWTAKTNVFAESINFTPTIYTSDVTQVVSTNLLSHSLRREGIGNTVCNMHFSHNAEYFHMNLLKEISVLQATNNTVLNKDWKTGKNYRSCGNTGSIFNINSLYFNAVSDSCVHMKYIGIW